MQRRGGEWCVVLRFRRALTRFPHQDPSGRPPVWQVSALGVTGGGAVAYVTCIR
jgi:hypothetical protein